MKKIRNWNWLLITPIFISAILIVIRFFYTKWFEDIECKTGLKIYQIIAFFGAISGLLWTNKRYKQGQENLKKTEESLEQNKKQSEESLAQNNYFKGLDNLTNEDSLKVEIGVQQLISLSKTNSKYNQGIKLAFIKRLKKPLARKEKDTLHFSFGQYIVDWLSKNFEEEELDLKGCNLNWHEFMVESNFEIFKIEGNIFSSKLSFRKTNLQKANLSMAYLTDADLTDADLIWANLSEANLSGADLSGADLIEANLTEANLTFANLTATYLIKANLTEADLTGADLKGADLRGAHLTEANLIEAVFTIDSLNTLSLNQLDSAKNVAKIKIYIYSEDKFYSLKEFVEMKPPNSINDNGLKLKKDMFDYFVELSKKN